MKKGMPPLYDSRAEFGDFQTPADLALRVCEMLRARGLEPATVIEPTCGKGAFVAAAANVFPDAGIAGYERNDTYARDAAALLRATGGSGRIVVGDFFEIDWSAELKSLAGPFLILGNPPWVTSAGVGSIGGANLPAKSNVDGRRGIEAITGSANFDISEWMLRQYLSWLEGSDGTVAVLCKTAVARRVLSYAWTRGVPLRAAEIYRLDARRYFGVAVDAGLFVLERSSGQQAPSHECAVYDSLDEKSPASTIGFREGKVVADVHRFDPYRDLYIAESSSWRSGLKHDSSRVFELSLADGGLINGYGQGVSIEPEVLFPLLKSSDVAHSRPPRKRVLVPQRSMDESPERLRTACPRAWRYLVEYGAILDARRSSIYRKRPRFSVFGVGPYSFAPWKVAISGLYKKLAFVAVGPVDGKPVIFDDTCYFLSCDSEDECRELLRLVSSTEAQEFWESLVFWDAKRPVTAKLLNSLSLARFAAEKGCSRVLVERLAS